MNKACKSFLDKDYRYNFANGPDIIKSEEDAQQNGLNCITLMHLLIKRLFDVNLPDYMKGWEMYKDNPYLVTVSSLEESKLGDIFFFGRPQLPSFALGYIPQYDNKGTLINKDEGDQLIGQQYAGIHEAMHTGEFASEDDPLLIHANKIESTVAVWPLSKFLDMEQYAELHAIKRIKE